MDDLQIRALWEFSDPALSETRFREAANKASDDITRAVIMTQIARAQGLQRAFEAGHATLDSIEGIENPQVAARNAIERGRLFNSAGAADQAVPFFQESLRMAEDSGQSVLAIDAAHMLGIAAKEEDRLGWNVRALALAEAAPDAPSRGWIGPLLNNIGWTYHDRGEYEKALGHFTRAAAWRRKAGSRPEMRIADWAIARTLRSLGRLEEALAIQERLSSELTEAGDSDPYVDEELGECLLALGDSDAAKSAFARAYAGLAADDWFVSNESDRLARLKELAGA